MKCAAAQERMDAFLDGELPAPERERLEAHLLECPECARTRELGGDVKRLIASAFPEPPATPAELAGLGARVRALAAERRKDWARPLPARPSSPALSWVAIAASLLLFAFLAAVWFSWTKGGGAEEVAPSTPGNQADLPEVEPPVPPAPAPTPDPERQRAALAMNLEAHRLAEAGEIEHAVLTFERLATLYPESFLAPRADFAAASLVGRDGPRAGAERFARFVAKRPAHELADDALCEAAALVLALEDVAEARTLFSRVLAEYPGGDRAAEAAFRLGKVEEDAGNREDALAAYRFAFEAYPRTSWAAKALERHRELEIR